MATDGSKANGEVRGVRKRVVVALVALAAVGAGVVAYIGGERTGAATAADTAVSSPRHQIYGDPAVVENIERGDFGVIFPRDGDRMLAIFAQPGRLMCTRGANPSRLTAAQSESFAAYAKTELTKDRDVEISANDPREVRELKQIVNGMRSEMRDYLTNGNGTSKSFWRRLNERTAEEMRIYERMRRELENETSHVVWEEKNFALRRLGLRTIPNPKE